MKKLFLYLGLGCGSWNAQAATAFPDIEIKSQETVRYRCKGGKSFNVTYLNAANDQSFARVSVQGEPLILVQVISASGAKYTAEQYVWWTKGERANLWDEMSDRILFSDCIAQKK